VKAGVEEGKGSGKRSFLVRGGLWNRGFHKCPLRDV